MELIWQYSHNFTDSLTKSYYLPTLHNIHQNNERMLQFFSSIYC